MQTTQPQVVRQSGKLFSETEAGRQYKANTEAAKTAAAGLASHLEALKFSNACNISIYLMPFKIIEGDNEMLLNVFTCFEMFIDGINY